MIAIAAWAASSPIRSSSSSLKSGAVELLGEIEGADHALRGDDRHAEERPHVGMRLGPPAAELGMLVDVARAIRRLRVEHRAEHAVLAGQRAERGDQLVVHPRGEEAAEATLAVGQPERGEAGAGEHAGAVDEPLQDLVDREPRRDREHGVADRRQCRVQLLMVQPLVHSSDDRSGGARVPRAGFHWPPRPSRVRTSAS